MPDPRSADHLPWLRQELLRWQQEGLISSDQASRILAGFRGQEALVVQTQAQRRIVAVLAVLGALLVGLGVILFFSANWQVLPRWFKLALVLSTTGAAYLLGYWLRFSKGYAGVGGAVLLLGALLYGAGIFLVGQIFHVEAEPHYGLLLWAIGVLPLGYLLPLNAMITLGVVILASWVLAVTFSGMDRYNFGDAFLPLRTILAAGIALYGAGRLHPRASWTRPFGRSHLITGALIVLAAFCVFTFLVQGHSWTTGAQVPAPLWTLELGATILGAAIVLANLVLDRRLLSSLAEWGGLAILLLAAWLAPYAARTELGLAGRSVLDWPWVLLVNLLFFGACLGATMLGVQRRDRNLVNIGLVFFALGIAARYIDIVGRLITQSLFFIGGGLLLLGGGWLVERARRRLLQRMEGGISGES